MTGVAPNSSRICSCQVIFLQAMASDCWKLFTVGRRYVHAFTYLKMLFEHDEHAYVREFKLILMMVVVQHGETSLLGIITSSKLAEINWLQLVCLQLLGQWIEHCWSSVQELGTCRNDIAASVVCLYQEHSLILRCTCFTTLECCMTLELDLTFTFPK